MSKLITSIKNLKQRSLDLCQFNQQLAVTEIRSLENSLDTIPTPPAYYDFLSTSKLNLSEESVIPHYLRIGYKEIELKDGNPPVRIPLTINLHETNALVFELEDNNSISPLQQIGFRLLLSLKPGLCHLHLIDANFGTAFAQLGHIKHPQLKTENINSSMGVEQLIKDLGSIIVDANQTYKARYANLTAHNSKAENKPLPYHVVLIDDFPENFTEAAITELKRIISKRNAINAGILIFINHCKIQNSNNSTSWTSTYGMRQFDIRPVLEECTLVSLDKNKTIKINGLAVPGPAKAKLDLGPINIEEHVQRLFERYKEERLNTKLLDQWIEELKESHNVWKGSTISGIKVPVGLIDKDKVFNFYMGDDSNSECLDFSALILGQTGTGKTFFLHTIITQLSMYYSPQELELYLLDFKQGTGFDRYRNLPHVKAVMSTNNIEFAYRVLLKLSNEATRRARLFKEATERTGHPIDNVCKYRHFTNEPLSRIVLVMDEFQCLFHKNNYNELVTAARDLLITGVKQWRSAGIIVILGTQTMSGVNIGEADSQISYRFAFTVGADDSRYLIGNEGATRLGREKGRCIMHNSPDRSEQLNVEFRNVWTEDNIKHITYLNERYKSVFGKSEELDPSQVCYVCDSLDVDVMENDAIAALSEDRYICSTYIGKPNILRHTHTRLCYKRRSYSNSVFIGQDTPTAINLIALSLIQAKKQSSEGSQFFIIDSTQRGDQYFNSFSKLSTLSNDFVVGSIAILDDLTQELKRRKAEIAEGSYTQQRIFFVMFNTQSEYSLRPTQGPFGVTKSQRSEQLCDLIKDGPALGIHCILHSLSFAEIFNKNGLIGDTMWQHFENKVLFEGADIQNMFNLNFKLRRFDRIEPDTLVVDNHGLDGEEFEFCKTYKKVNKDTLMENLTQLI